MRRYKEGLFAEPERLDIHLSFKNYQKLAHRVHLIRSTNQKHIRPEDKIEVKATLIKDEKEYKAKIALKGLWLDHLQGDKWSFKVRIKGNKTLWGMKKFSIHSPSTRSYSYEWVYQQASKWLGNIFLRYDFIDVYLNGKYLGVYAVEEFFEKYLVENNNRREGILVKPSQTDIRLLKEKKIKKKPYLYAQYKLARDLYRLFQSRKISAGQVYDIEKTAKYFALSDIFGGHHGHNIGNMVLYFDPITTKFEPIPFDSMTYQMLWEYYGMYMESRAPVGIFQGHPYLQPLFADREFFERYVFYLKKYSAKGFFDPFFRKIKSERQKKEAIIFSEYLTVFMRFKDMDEWIFRNQEYIRNYIAKFKSVSELYNTVADKFTFVADFKKESLSTPAYIKNVILPNYKKFSWLNISSKEIVFPASTVRIRENLIIPKGKKVIIPAGAKIHLDQGTSIISYSPIEMLGSQKSPILFSGGGFIVLQAKEETSRLKFVTFKDVKALKYKSYAPTGGVTFYETPLLIEDCVFNRNFDSDDLLNVVRSTVKVERTKFLNSNSDAFDCDFCLLTLNEVQFLNSGNDGLDVSGSKVIGTNLVFEQAGDKAISIGENSESEFRNISIDNAVIGVASKDLSRVYAEGVSISKSKYGLVSYRKKSEYGPGTTIAKNITLKEVEMNFLIEKKSKLILDGNRLRLKTGNKEVLRKLYPEFKNAK